MSSSEETSKPEQIDLANLNLDQLVQIKLEFDKVSDLALRN